MQALIIQRLVQMIFTFASRELIDVIGPKILDAVENAVTQSESKIDDAVVLPLCQRARQLFDKHNEVVEQNSDNIK